MFRIEYDHRVIIKFLWNDRADARDIADRLQAQFGEHAYKLWTIQFCITEVRLRRQDLQSETRTGNLPLDDLDGKMLAILDKSLFEPTHSIIATLYVAHSKVLLHLHDSVGFRLFHLHWVSHLLMHGLYKKERNMQKRCRHSWMLPNMMAGIISWQVMTHGISWKHHDVACGLCREIMWSQNRGLVFRTKTHVSAHMESETLPCCRQTPKWC
jgi:hypothetical protein